MIVSLIKLDFDRCKNYCYDQIKDLGYFSSLVEEKNIISDGTFYCVAPINTDQEMLYKFNEGGNVFSLRNENKHHIHNVDMYKVVNYAKDFAISFIYEYLNNDFGSNRCLLMEDFYARPTDPWVLDTNPIYYLADQVMIYIINKGADRKFIKEYYEIASMYPFALYLTTNPLNHIKPFEVLQKEGKEQLMGSINIALFEIYDKESFLIWVKKDAEEIFDKAIQNIKL